MRVLRTWLLSILLCTPIIGQGWSKGIYVTQPTVESTKKLNNLIKKSKAAGIDTFVIDTQYKNSRYERNLKLVHDAGIKFVSRIVVFPDGGTALQVNNQSIWEKRLKLAEYAISLGAKEIQLDYIRYNVKGRASDQKAQDVKNVIRWFDKKLEPTGVKLQIAVFGETSFGPSRTIGQDIKLFAEHVDVVNPMVYPSHYEPHSYYGVRPYHTVKKSMDSLQEQFGGDTPFTLVPYIEVSNYRRPMGFATKVDYIKEQIRAAKEGGADGWYAWSPTNRYEPLFRALGNQK